MISLIRTDKLKEIQLYCIALLDIFHDSIHILKIKIVTNKKIEIKQMRKSLTIHRVLHLYFGIFFHPSQLFTTSGDITFLLSASIVKRIWVSTSEQEELVQTINEVNPLSSKKSNKIYFAFREKYDLCSLPFAVLKHLV